MIAMPMLCRQKSAEGFDPIAGERFHFLQDTGGHGHLANFTQPQKENGFFNAGHFRRKPREDRIDQTQQSRRQGGILGNDFRDIRHRAGVLQGEPGQSTVDALRRGNDRARANFFFDRVKSCQMLLTVCLLKKC